MTEVLFRVDLCAVGAPFGRGVAFDDTKHLATNLGPLAFHWQLDWVFGDGAAPGEANTWENAERIFRYPWFSPVKTEPQVRFIIWQAVGGAGCGFRRHRRVNFRVRDGQVEWCRRLAAPHTFY